MPGHKFMNRSVIFLFLGGLLLISGIFTIGTAIYNAFNTTPRYVETFWVDTEHSTGIISVNTKNFVQIAVKMSLSGESIKEDFDDNRELQYQFPFRYQIYDNQQNLLFEQQTAINWNSGSRTTTSKQVGPGRGTLNVETSFEKLKISSPGEIQIVSHIESDDIYNTTADKIELIVYDNVYRHSQRIALAAGLLFLGVIGLFAGLVTLANRTTPPNGETILTDGEELTSTEKNIAVAVHLSAFSGYIVPFGGLLAPLIIWMLKRNDHRFIDMHGKEAVNFRISLVIYFMISFVLCFLLVGFILILLLWLLDLIFTISAAIKASEGKTYRYPLAIRFIK